MKAPSILELFAFALPGHHVFNKETMARHGEKLRNVECVTKLPGGGVVGRLLEGRTNLPTAAIRDETSWDFQLRRHLKEVGDLVATEDIAHLAALAARALGRLAFKARTGDAEALWLFASVVNEAGEGLSQMTRANPKALAPVAWQSVRWPLMVSPHPMNSDPKEWIDALELGRNTQANLSLNSSSKWKPGFASNYAIRLYLHLEKLRTVDLVVNGQPVEKWLPKFSSKTASEWFNVAWEFLCFSYPQPETLPELDRLVTSPSKRKSPGRRRQAIKDVLRRAFLALALKGKKAAHLCDCGQVATTKTGSREWVCATCLKLEASYHT